MSALTPELLDAIGRIYTVPACAMRCVCGSGTACAGRRDWNVGACCCEEVYAVDGQAYDTLECLAYQLLCDHHPAQDQSDAARDEVLAAIEDNFARARAAAQVAQASARLPLCLASTTGGGS